MENNHRKAFNLYTQGQRWAVRVLVFVGLLGSFVPQNALAFNIFRVIQCVIVGSAVWGDGVMGPSGVSAQLTQACLNEGKCLPEELKLPVRRLLEEGEAHEDCSDSVQLKDMNTQSADWECFFSGSNMERQFYDRVQEDLPKLAFQFSKDGAPKQTKRSHTELVYALLEYIRLFHQNEIERIGLQHLDISDWEIFKENLQHYVDCSFPGMELQVAISYGQDEDGSKDLLTPAESQPEDCEDFRNTIFSVSIEGDSPAYYAYVPDEDKGYEGYQKNEEDESYEGVGGGGGTLIGPQGQSFATGLTMDEMANKTKEEIKQECENNPVKDLLSESCDDIVESLYNDTH